MPRPRLISVAVTALVASGCASAPPAPGIAPTPQLTLPNAFPKLEATVAVPDGWTLNRRDEESNYTQKVWISPSGATAFGVVRFSVPLPSTHDMVLWVFMRQMRASEGNAALLSKTWDKRGKFLRFETKGGRFHVHGNLIVRGLGGWVVYAGTRAGDDVNPREFDLAVQARESVELGSAE